MYPAMLNITHQLITIIGGGKVAYRKTQAFLEFGGRVRIISPVFYEGFNSLKDTVELLSRNYSEQDIEESFLIVAATNDKEVNQKIGTYCKARGKLCNVVDDIHLSSFIVPAYMKSGDLIISISTNGKSPSLAKQIKKDLKNKYDEFYIEYLEILGRIREKVIKSYKEEEKRKKILEHIITLNLEELKIYEKNLEENL